MPPPRPHTSRCRRSATPDRLRTHRAPRVRSRPGRTSHVEQHVQYLSVFHRIGFPFRTHDPELLRVGLAPGFEKLLPSDDLRADEAALEIRVDRARRLFRRRAARNGPPGDLLVAGRPDG